MSKDAMRSPSRLREGLGMGQSGPRSPASTPDPSRKREGRP